VSEPAVARRVRLDDTAAVPVPLIVYGPGSADKDNEVLVAVAEATKGENICLANCEDKNYRTIVAAALGNGHLVAAFSPTSLATCFCTSGSATTACR